MNMRKVILFVIAVSSFALPSFSMAQIMSVFEYPVDAKRVEGSAPSVSINPAFKSAQIGQVIDVKLPDGGIVQLTVSQRQRKTTGVVVITAQDQAGTEMVMSIGKKASFASISGDDIDYTLGFSPQTGQFMRDTKEIKSALDFSGDMVVPPARQTQTEPPLNNNEQSTSQIAPQTITPAQQNNFSSTADMTILVVYSPEFGVGFGDPQARIEQLVAFTNQALTSTGVNGQFRLVATQEIDFDNETALGTLLNQATFASGAFTSLPSLRDSVGADMISVLSFNDNFFGAGVAWVNGDNPNFAYSVSNLSLFCCDSVFAHELGHNLGSGHERDAVNPTSDSCDDSFQPGGFTGFSCGFGSQGLGFGTLMSRLNATINRFSNPNQLCNGVPCGVPAGLANAADNFTSFNQSVFLVENFRANIPTPSTGNNGNGSIIVPILPLLLDEE